MKFKLVVLENVIKSSILITRGNCKWRVPLDGGSPPEWSISLWRNTHQVFVTMIVIMTVIINIAIMQIKVIVEI